MNAQQARILKEVATKELQTYDVLPPPVGGNGWAKVYVEAERPIPERWRNAFYDELTASDLDYRHRLEESLRWFGVRWI